MRQSTDNGQAAHPIPHSTDTGAAAPAPERGTRVLVVDDNRGDYVLVTALLAEVPGTIFHTFWVDQPEAVLEAIETHNPDICLIDYRLGANTGLEVTHTIAHRQPDIPIVMLTGHVSDNIDEEAMRAGVSDFLDKSHLEGDMLHRTIRYAIKQKNDERQLMAMATTDDLTGLDNRKSFYDKLHHALTTAARTNHAAALLFIDLDRFKHINDSLGHAMGDELLRAVSRRLLECCRTSDTVARLGGDEFAIIAANLNDPIGVTRLADKLLAALSEPFEIGPQTLHTSGSIGISIYPRDSSMIETLLANADMALYRAKSEGRNGYSLFDNNMDRVAQERKDVTTNLRNAISAGHLFLEYQPFLDLDTGRVVGAEALVRWDKPGQGTIYPDKFIAVAESSGLISVLGDWVLRAACEQIIAWQAQGLPPFPVAVNVSPAQLNDKAFLTSLHATLAETGVSPHLIEIEITEGMVIPDLAVSGGVFDELRQLGVGVSIDDFGTGPISLDELRKLPISKLKIDRSFVSDIDTDASIAAVAEAIIHIGKGFKLSVIAEGVETAEQLALLRMMGSDQAQGYYISRPLKPEAFVNWLRQHIAAAYGAAAE